MVKVAIISKTKEKKDELKALLPKYNIDYDEDNPNLIISYGGDGLFLYAERIRPKIPKVLMRDSKICNNCPNMEPDEILQRISDKKYRISELPKLKAVHSKTGKKTAIYGINDIVFRNHIPTEAIRFKYKINESEFSEELIGDGMVIATPFGSKKGAYFHTITRKRIKGKIGMAFNNVSKPLRNEVINFKDKIEIQITRSKGVLVADNNPDYIMVEEGDTIEVFQDKEKVKIVNFNFDS